jgi:TatD DNase family protein
MNFIDTHTHLYDERLIRDPEQIKRAIEAGVRHMYMPNCNSETIGGMMELAALWPENCFPMMGLHPCYVKEDYKAELGIVEEWLKKERFFAVGEIGLDYYWDLTYKTQQIEAFEHQIGLAQQYNIPIVIHSRESTQDCIDIVRRHQTGRLTGIFHCFGGTIQEADQIINLGFHVGLGGVVTYKNSGMADVVDNIPLTGIVLETDAPYLAPVPYRGKRNESSYLPAIAAKIAEIKGIPVSEVAAVTTTNANRIFGNL